MVTKSKAEATIDDLYQVEGKAEIVNGQIVLMPASGDMPGSAAGELFVSLREYARSTGQGRVYGDTVGFIVNLPNRRSFSPDTSFHIGGRRGMKFLEGAPIFAVEIRSEGDYGPAVERAMARKRDDYFAAGTLVVWDVDLVGEDVVRVYRNTDPGSSTVYRRGEEAEAEPALPGWRIPVNSLFE